MAEILKFKCERCGQRIAVQPRHLNKLITCPECGQKTHPLAEEIVSAREPVAAGAAGSRAGSKRTAAAGAATDRACANCGDPIGRLQKVKVWENDVVCTPCYKKLSSEATRTGAAAIREAPAASKPGRGSRWSRAKTNPSPPIEKVEVQRLPGPARAADVGGVPQETHALATAPVTFELGGRRPGDVGPGLRTIPLTWGSAWATLRGRLLALLVVVCVLAAAVYGAMSLLRDIAGLIAAVAFIMLGAVVTWLLLRATLHAGKRLVAARFKATAPAATEPAKADGESELKALPQRP